VAADDDLVSWLAGIWEEALDVRPIGPGDDFFDLGGDSLAALQILDRLRAALRRDLPMTTLLQRPTPARLAEVLRGVGATVPRPAVVPLSVGGAGPPFFCMPGAGGSVFRLRALAHLVGGDRPFYGLQFHGTGPQAGIPHRIEAIADHLAGEVRAAHPEGPYLLGGYSFGGRVAYEMAQRLRADGLRVALLCIFDTWGPGFPRALPAGRRLTLHLRCLLGRGPRAGARHALSVARNVAAVSRRLFAAPRTNEGDGEDELPSDATARLLEANLRASRAYVPRPYPGPMTLFRASEHPHWFGFDFRDPLQGWGRSARGELEVHPVPGDHWTLFDEPNVRVLAAELAACLRGAETKAR
jgi:thioesterase domain-containing protein